MLNQYFITYQLKRAAATLLHRIITAHWRAGSGGTGPVMKVGLQPLSLNPQPEEKKMTMGKSEATGAGRAKGSAKEMKTVDVRRKP